MTKSRPEYDINLLRTFVTVYETRNVTEAARRLFVSQPSVSYSLSKLRRLFDDPLFLRTGSGLGPTPLAERLYPEVLQGIQQLDSLVQDATEFDATETTRTFRLMMTDLGLMALFSYIVSEVEKAAPHARVDVSLVDVNETENMLRHNAIDAAIAIPEFSHGVVVRDHLMDMPYIGVCAAEHPRLQENPTVADLKAEKRVVVTNTLGHQHVEDRLGELGIACEPEIVLPTYSVVDETLMATQCYCIVPLFLGDMFVRRSSIKQFKLPFSVEPGHVGLHTLRRVMPSPPTEWLRALIQEALKPYPYPKYVRDY